MKIESSAVLIAASSYQSSVTSRTESLNAWDNRGQIKADTDAEDSNKESQDYMVTLLSKLHVVSKSSSKGSIFEMSDKDRAEISLLQRMIEALTGKKMHFLVPVQWTENTDNGGMPLASQGNTVLASPGVGWGFNYSRTDTVVENASMQFNAGGIVKTADGREINFSLDLNISRSFVQQESLTIRAGDALLDPLVVNFNAASAELSDQKVSFDLDNDGSNENISFVKAGSGFLALDKNGDGIVNNGSELFGPSSGNGFLELADYDSDKNGWIDENDPIYDQLRIWTKNEQGEDELFAIGQVGIGAIFVKGIGSAFELKNAANDLQGKIQQTGVFLRENGVAGTMQNIDLAI